MEIGDEQSEIISNYTKKSVLSKRSALIRIACSFIAGEKSYCKQLMEMFWNNVTYECVPIYFLLFTHDELTEKIRLSIESNVE